MSPSLLLRRGLAVTPEGTVPADVLVTAGRVAAVAPPGTADAPDDAVILDCGGCWIGPGFVDLHAHLREPGFEWKEDTASGSAAAVAGGYTAVVAMPNTDPPLDSGHLARAVADRGREVGLVEVVAAGCLTMGRSGDRLAHLDELWDAGVRLFTDDGDTVSDGALLRLAMEHLADRGGVVAQHAVDPTLARGGHLHEGPVSSRLGIPGIPVAAEVAVVARDLELVRITGARYHLQHVSAARVLALLAAAKDEGLPVTAEVTPHHLAFRDVDAAGADPLFKMMPPLRAEDDRQALVAALRSGLVDCVATDHAPHAPQEKDVPFEEAPNGVSGLEWAAAVVHTVVGLDPDAFYDRLAVTPARIAGLADQGRLVAPGAPANLAVFDPDVAWTPETTLSRSGRSPYLGRRLRGRVRHTVSAGRLVVQAGRPAVEVGP